jgi:hypothetical protein
MSQTFTSSATSNTTSYWRVTYSWTIPPRREPPDEGLAGCYARLGVPPSSPPDVVRKAFRDRIKEVHSDAGGSEDEAAALIGAYRRLTR